MAETDPDAKKTAEPGSDEAILRELNERFDYASTMWQPIVDEGDIDVRYSAGHTFDADDLTARKGRLTIELDQLSQYSNQLVNSFRQNPRGAKVSPAGGGDTKETAELRANRIRQIEYDSHAQEVYTVAGENMVTRGYGYARIVAEYEDSDQRQPGPAPEGHPEPEAGGCPIRTPRARPAPTGVPVLRPHDHEGRVHAQLSRRADQGFRAGPHLALPAVVREGRPRSDRRILVRHRNPVADWEGQTGSHGLPVPDQRRGAPARARASRSVGEWKGSTIPFASAYGKIIYETDESGNSQKMLQSYIRLARDAAKAYNWTASTKLEALALPVKASLFAYEGQLDANQVALVERATREHIPLITAKATTEATGQQVLPLPQYGMRAPDISGYEVAGESFRRDIQNALGRYSVQDHRLGSTKVTSGVALRELDKSGDLGSYHFVAHYDDMIRELADKLNELLPFYDDTEKEVDTRLPDGSTKRVRVNAMTGRAPNGEPAYAPDDLRLDPAHRHTVTISTGPSFDSQREQGKDAAMTLLGNQQAFPIIAADAVRLMDLGPIGDQMAKDLEYLQPPVMQQARQQEQGGGKQDPRALAQQLAQIHQQLQHAEQVMQQQHQELVGKQAELASKEKIAGMQAKSAERLQITLQKMKDATSIAVAKINALTKGVISDGEAQMEQIAIAHEAALAGLQMEHEKEEAALDRQHTADQAAAAQAHAAGMAAAGASAAADAQQTGHEQSMEQAQQAADLAPPPAEAGV
jgi:hypothetical protein